MTRDDLKDWVAAKVDEIAPAAENAEGATLHKAPIEYMEQELNHAANYILGIAPKELVMPAAKKATEHAPGSAVSNRLVIKANGSGFYVLPSDFNRFIAFKLTSWRRPVYELMKEDDPKYDNQFNKFLRGNPLYPVGVFIPFTDYVANEIDAGWVNVNYAIEFFSTENQSDTVEYMHYIPNIVAENAPDKLLDPIAWECASRVMEIMGRGNDAKTAHERAMRQLTNFKKGLIGERFNP